MGRRVGDVREESLVAPMEPLLDSHALWFLQPDVVDNPYPLYHRMRTEDPVHWSEAWGAWLLFRHRDVVATLRDPRFSLEVVPLMVSRVPVESRARIEPIAKTMSNWVLFQDPPRHSRLRSSMSKALTPEMMKRVERQSHARADRLLDEAVRRNSREMDVVADLAFPLPAGVILQMLVGSVSLSDDAMTWSHDIATIMGKSLLSAADVARAERSMAGMTDFFRSSIAHRRRAPQDDLISGLLAVRELTDEEILHNVIALFVAGHETSTELIANTVLALLQDRSLIELLVREPKRADAVVEEVLRHDGPTQVIPRLALEDVRIGDKTILQGQVVNLMLGAANRDPAQFPQPDSFVLDRPNVRHVAFGHGIHFCLGAFIARQEARVAISRLLARFPSIEMIEAKPERHATMAMRALKSLRVQL